MDIPKIFIHNIETGEETLRDMTPEELEEIKLFEPSTFVLLLDNPE